MDVERIINLTRQLYPTGRAFRMPPGSILYRLHKALAISESRAYLSALRVLDSFIPDNDNFNEDDAQIFEHKYGLISSSAVPLEDRKKAIVRKINHPGNIRMRQSALYLEGQLQAAGFNVRVYQNRFFDDGGKPYTKPINEIVGSNASSFAQHGQFQHGDVQHGFVFTNIVANYVDEHLDSTFNVGSNLRSTLFICGDTIGNYGEVPVARKLEFRQLILRIKPVQCVAYLLINYK